MNVDDEKISDNMFCSFILYLFENLESEHEITYRERIEILHCAKFCITVFFNAN